MPVQRGREGPLWIDDRAASWLDLELARHLALGALDDAAVRLAAVIPTECAAADARLCGVAHGINDEVEREGDDAPFA